MKADVDDDCADPCGVLGPNEIHVKCSRPSLKTDDGLETDIVVGDVLVSIHRPLVCEEVE